MGSIRIFALISGLAALLSSAGLGQTVVAIGGQSKELKRAAHQLRISPDRLQNAREALRQAAELARRNPDSMTSSQLGQLLTRLDKTRAPAALEDLCSWFAVAAKEAPDLPSYSRATQAAQNMLRTLATLDPEKAAALWMRWPDPPATLGEEFRKRQEESRSMFAKQLSATSNPYGLPTPTYDPADVRDSIARGDFTRLPMLMSQLTLSDDRTDGLRLVDQAIAKLQQSQPDQRMLSGYMNMLRQLPPIDPTRFTQGLNSLLPALEQLGGASAGGTVKVGEQTLQVTGAEAAVIELCRSMYGRPELAMKTLSSMPGLKAKLDRIGGIDSLGMISMRGGPSVSIDYSIDGVNRTTFNSTPTGSVSGTRPIGMESPGNAEDLVQSLRGKWATDPGFVRQKIAEAAKTPDQADAVLMLASRLAMQEPDAASLALEAVMRLLPQVEPLSRRAVLFQRIIQAYQICDGEVDADVLQKGMQLAQELREKEKESAPRLPEAQAVVASRMGTPADQLEMAIVAQLAIDNFEGAMRYVRTLSEDQKLQALIRIAQTLSQPF